MAVEPRKLLTYEDFLAFPDDGVRREIVDGEVFVTPSPNVRHQDLIGYLFTTLYNHIEAHGGGRVFVAPLDDRLSEHDIVEPDVIFVSDNRSEIIKEKYLLGAPSLAVEVVSDPRHDRIRKRALYARAGVPVYWIVDPDADRVEVHRLIEGAYGKPEILETGDTLTLDDLPGLAIDVSRLFDR
jgi:Uma2 family endonuclease